MNSQSASIAKHPLSEEYMLVAQATGSTCNGCSANSAAPQNAAAGLATSLRSTRNASPALIEWTTRLNTWNGAGDIPCPGGPAPSGWYASTHSTVYVTGT